MKKVRTVFLCVIMLTTMLHKPAQSQITPTLSISTHYLKLELDSKNLKFLEIILPEISLQSEEKIVSAGSAPTILDKPILTNIILKQILPEENNTLYEWFKETVEGHTGSRTIRVILMNSSSNTEICRWDFLNAFPVKYQPVLSGGKMVEIFEVAYGNWKKD